MSVVQSKGESPQWLADDEMKELNEEWVERGPSSFDFRNYDPEESGTVKQKPTVNSVVARNNGIDKLHDEVTTTKQNMGNNLHQTPEWKRALNHAENNITNHNSGTMAWNSFFKAPTLKGVEASADKLAIGNSKSYKDYNIPEFNNYTHENSSNQQISAVNDIREISRSSIQHSKIQDDSFSKNPEIEHESDQGAGNDTDNETGYDTENDTNHNIGHDTRNEIYEDGDESLPSSKSRLKVFQKHDTYTNCRLEDLLGTMVKGAEQSNTHSTTGSKSSSESGTESDISEIIQDDNYEAYSSTQTRHWSSTDRRDITTQDFMDNAESLMKKLMGSVSNNLDDIDTEEGAEIKEEASQFQTDSYKSNDSEAEEYTNHQRYQNYEDTDYLRTNGANPSTYESSETSEIFDPKDLSCKSHNGKLGPPVQVSVPNNVKHQNIKIIKQEDIKGIIPSKIGSMNYDEQNRKWHHQNDLHRQDNFDNSLNSRANMTDEHDIFHGIDDLSDTRPVSPSIRSQHSSDAISQTHFSQAQSTTNGICKSYNNTPNKKFIINNNLINNFEPSVLDLENEKGLDFQQKLQSIKGCIIETPRSIQFPNTLDKEVSFALPSDHVSTEQNDKSLVSPALLNNVAYSGVHHISNDVTHISQIDSSFGHSMTQLVEAFTTRYPNQMLWDKLTSVDISNSSLESLARLNTICPFVKTLDASHNNISVLQGIPFSVTRLDMRVNNLSNLSNFGGLDNIQYLNIAFNEIETFNCLSHLSHLRELTADGCPVTNLNGLSRIDGLLKLSVKGGLLETLDGGELKLSLLQTLNLSSNKIKQVSRLEQLISLRSLNLGMFFFCFFCFCCFCFY